MATMGRESGISGRQRCRLNKRTIDPNDPRFVTVSSESNSAYNCVAWALGIRDQWWEPHAQGSIRQGQGYWPDGAAHNRDPQTLRQIFRQQGFADCENGDPEPNVVKIALYRTLGTDGNYKWTHVARQLRTGSWTSKLGNSYEVTHRKPDDLDGHLYGDVYAYMAKPRRGDDPQLH